MKAISLLSGGLDSLCFTAFLIVKDGFKIYPITFSYGQRNRWEVETATRLAKELECEEIKVLEVNLQNIVKSSLLGCSEISREYNQSLVVPLRNMIFLSIACSYAVTVGADIVAYGALKDEEERFYDCSTEFVQAMNKCLETQKIGVKIISPSVYGWGKKELLKIGYECLKELGKEHLIRETISCYNPTDGRECGECYACIRRREAFESLNLQVGRGI